MENAARKVLVVGSGGREHALARVLLRGRDDREVIVTPGNGGIAGDRLRRADVAVSDTAGLVALAKREGVDLVVIGPEAPLCAGLSDALGAEGFVVFGASQAAARLEGSKAFLKEFAVRHGIPTAPFTVVRTVAEAEAAIAARGAPIVVKADGLCAGKGVVVAESVDEARTAARQMIEDRIFGDAGATVVIEEKIVGREVSVHAICDGERFVVLPPARDHKRVFDGDRGPNTGGMGVICPTDDVSPQLMERIVREVIAPTIEGMKSEGAPFRGVLFAGLMIDAAGIPLLLEHNVRFGDPECEAMMELFDCDVGAVLASAARGTLDPATVSFARDRYATVVILASAGYPDKPRLGDRIEGIDRAEALGATVHHAGTKREADGVLLTSGGRVLAVTASAGSLDEARAIAYRGADAIEFSGKHLRRDIGKTVA
ncbi:MAG: phosphoribosylamine--glycine ligase [Polyangiaceae bacterium]|nr:phosphoribosylamine--glycine ligase [Polyangiaceae bacterium]